MDPRPGPTKKALVGYENVCRVRAGKYRIIYSYTDQAVLLISVRIRNDDTYDDIDDLEAPRLAAYKSGIATKARQNIDWETAAKWLEPAPKKYPLPEAISTDLMTRLGIPPGYHDVLRSIRTCEELCDCIEVPDEHRDALVDHFFPRQAPVVMDSEPLFVQDVEHLVDPFAANSGGPLDAAKAIAGNTTKELADPSHATPPNLPARQRSQFVVRPSLQLEPMKPYRGNSARGISRDARYAVLLDHKIRLIYNVGQRESALLTTDAHPALVEMVNQAKRMGGSSGGGAFVINEFRHVLVPLLSGETLYAGVYTRDLEFEFEGDLISPVAPPGISRGDLWPGPHAGIKYTLAAGASDIRYDRVTERGTSKQICLTDYHAKQEVAGLLEMFRAVKPMGGAIYINEAREFFAPVESANGYERRYIGHLGHHPWFPLPE